MRYNILNEKAGFFLNLNSNCNFFATASNAKLLNDCLYLGKSAYASKSFPEKKIYM